MEIAKTWNYYLKKKIFFFNKKVKEKDLASEKINKKFFLIGRKIECL